MTTLDTESASLLLHFDNNVYSLAAIKKAANKYAHLFATDIYLDGDRVACRLSFSHTVNRSNHPSIVDEFKKEILDQDLREGLKAETEPIRNVIFALAFSKSGVFTDGEVSRD